MRKAFEEAHLTMETLKYDVIKTTQYKRDCKAAARARVRGGRG